MPDTVTLTRSQVRQLAEDAIRLYLEYRQVHEWSRARSIAGAVQEVVEDAFAELPTPKVQSRGGEAGSSQSTPSNQPSACPPT